MRLHRKIWLWWGRWWAVQVVLLWDELALGVRLNWQRRVLDLYLCQLTIAVGRHPVRTDPRTAQRDCCRGFLFEEPLL